MRKAFAKSGLLMSIIAALILTGCRLSPSPTITPTTDSITESVKKEIEPAQTLQPTNTDAPIIPTAPNPSLEPTSTGVSEPKTLIAIPLQQSNCRSSCNTTQAAISDTLIEGVEYFAIGQNSSETWLQFIGSHSGESCWVLNTSINLWWSDLILEQAAVPK